MSDTVPNYLSSFTSMGKLLPYKCRFANQYNENISRGSGSVVRIHASQAWGPGSIPGFRIYCFFFITFFQFLVFFHFGIQKQAMFTLKPTWFNSSNKAFQLYGIPRTLGRREKKWQEKRI